MEIEHLRQIVHLSKTLNFSETARQLFISQPTLSKHVKAVETQLDVSLFVRDGRSVHLTEDGRQFISLIENVIKHYDTALITLNKKLYHEQCTFTIGYNDIIPKLWKDQISQVIRKIRPSTEIKLKLCNPSKLIKMLKADEIDLAIAPAFPDLFKDPSLFMHKFPRSKLALVCSDDHPLAANKSILLADFRNELMLVPDVDIPTGQPLYNFFKKHSISINEESRFSSFFEASAMVSMKLGLALLPQYVSEFSFLNVKFIPIEDVNLFVYPMMLWRKFGKNHLTKRFSSYFLTE